MVIGVDGQLPQATASHAVAEAILTAGRPWRLAMGPTAVLEILRERAPIVPLVCRDQIYYRGDQRTAAADLVDPDVRPAQRADRDQIGRAHV